MEACSRGATRKRRIIKLGGLAETGDLYGECSNGVCVSNEEVLRCVPTASEAVVGIDEVAGILVL